MRSSPAQAPLDPPGVPIRHLVFLVHGTWGNGLAHSLMWPWLSPERRHRENRWPVREKLEAAGFTTRPFTWSGRNTHWHRRKAASELAECLNSTSRKDDRLSVVAHSHGGAVVLQALKQLPDATIGGVVCLATPFLHFSPQAIDLTVFKSLPLATAFLAFGVSAPAVLFALATLGWTDRLGTPASIVLMLVGAVAVAWALERAARRIVERLETAKARAMAICDAHAPATLRPGQLLILRNVADEASAAIGTGTFVEWLLTAFWRTMSAVELLPHRIAGVVGGYFKDRPRRAALALVATIVGIAMFAAPVMMAIAYSGFGVAVAILGLGLAGLALLAAVLVLNMVRLGTTEGLLATAFVRVAAEATPLGSWEVELYPGHGFAHSQIHEDPAAADRIVEWLRSRGA